MSPGLGGQAQLGSRCRARSWGSRLWPRWGATHGVWGIALEVGEMLPGSEWGSGRLESSGIGVTVVHGFGDEGPAPGFGDRAWDRRTTPGIRGTRLCWGRGAVGIWTRSGVGDRARDQGWEAAFGVRDRLGPGMAAGFGGRGAPGFAVSCLTLGGRVSGWNGRRGCAWGLGDRA